MKLLPVEASDQEILDAVQEWVGMLIDERYADACSFFYTDDGPRRWTPELMSTLIHNYGSLQSWHNGKVFKVTSLEDAKVHPSSSMPCHEVNRFQDDHSEDSEEVVDEKEMAASDTSEIPTYYPGYVWFDLPLNGQWSDLTAILNLHVLNNQLVFELESIHVM